MADYDAPAFIDYVLKETKLEKISWIGHSQGNIQLFYGLSPTCGLRKYFRDRINLFIALGPVTKLDNLKSPVLRFMMQYYEQIKWVFMKLNFYEFFGGEIWIDYTKTICALFNESCTLFSSFIFNQNPNSDDNERLQVYAGHLPGGGSTKSYQHLAQSFRSGKF